MNQRYDLLIFDWDGTLVDSITWIVKCMQHAARASGFEVPTDHAARSVIGLSLHQAMQMLYPGSTGDMALQLVAHYRDLYHTQPDTALSFFEGVHDMLRRFRHQGYKLSVATGKSRSALDAIMARTGIDQLFHATRCGDETASKPDPLMIEQLLETLAIPRQRALLVGDSLHDMRLARNAGIDAIAVTCGANTADELMELSPLLCIERPTDLIPLLERES